MISNHVPTKWQSWTQLGHVALCIVSKPFTVDAGALSAKILTLYWSVRDIIRRLNAAGLRILNPVVGHLNRFILRHGENILDEGRFLRK